MNRTAIPYVDFSFSPIKFRTPEGRSAWHCEKTSAGCQKCYAERLELGRFGSGRPFTKEDGKDLTLFLDKKELSAPLRLKKPAVIFIGDMSDYFGSWIPFPFIDMILLVAALTPGNTYLMLTKRAEIMKQYFDQPNLQDRIEKLMLFPDILPPGFPFPRAVADWPLPNLWCGVTCENQDMFDLRWPLLEETNCAHRWISHGPALSGLDLDPDKGPAHALGCGGGSDCEFCHETKKNRKVEFVVSEGMSGPGFVPDQDEWYIPLSQQCLEAGVPFMLKQRAGVHPEKLPKLDGAVWDSTPWKLQPKVAKKK